MAMVWGQCGGVSTLKQYGQKTYWTWYIHDTANLPIACKFANSSAFFHLPQCFIDKPPLLWAPHHDLFGTPTNHGISDKRPRMYLLAGCWTLRWTSTNPYWTPTLGKNHLNWSTSWIAHNSRGSNSSYDVYPQLLWGMPVHSLLLTSCV